MRCSNSAQIQEILTPEVSSDSASCRTFSTQEEDDSPSEDIYIVTRSQKKKNQEVPLDPESIEIISKPYFIPPNIELPNNSNSTTNINNNTNLSYLSLPFNFNNLDLKLRE